MRSVNIQLDNKSAVLGWAQGLFGFLCGRVYSFDIVDGCVFFGWFVVFSF